MFEFQKRDDGLFAVRTSDGRAVAHVDTREISYSDHVDGDPKKPKLAQIQQFVKVLPRDRWQIHFTAVKLTPAELEAFVKELAAQEG